MAKKNRVAVLISLISSLVFGAAGGTLATLALVDDQVINSPVIVDNDATSLNYAWETASPSVISVVALKDVSQFYNQFFFFNGIPPEGETGQLQQVSSGTAFIVTKDGLAITNGHVVSDTSATYVAFLNDGTQVDVEVVARDSLNDIAVLKLSGEGAKNLNPVDFADSDQIEVGDTVLAIGNALGEYANTTTAGIISATNRQITAGGYGSGTKNLVGLIQTDAAINPGNSGGPLVNMEGNVIGMNTAIDAQAQGIGFAIPANDIKTVLDSYEEYGRIVRPYLGVRYMILNEAIAEQNNLSVDYGAYIIGDVQNGLLAVLEGSPADKAGLKEGDIILSADGQKIEQNFDLSNAIAEHTVGEKLKLEVLRDRKTINVEVTLEENKA